MPDYLVDTKKKTVNLKCSFFLSLTRKICKTETDDVSTKANFPTRRQAQSSTKSRQILQRPSQRNENRE